ncbi:MAG: hypothetical protein K6T65_03205 [Peptococcaceae bacterium]|nr:hypothetical protein [Peptococcaceae bacterium]
MSVKEHNDDLDRSSENYSTLKSREDYYNEGFRLHEQALAGNLEAAKKALELWQQAYKKYPEDAVAQAYYGISMVLVGRDSPDFGKFLADSIKGLIYLNRAIERDPNNPHVRVLLTYLSKSMPEAIFNKPEKAYKDPESLKEAGGQDNSLFSKEYRELFNDVGMIYHLGKKVVSELKGIKDTITGKKF